ncbi:MAG: hypothetical protein KDN20_13885 [Verrucomicrobiae bacterium]|nr:hypothetical protein [Verrucomicrobiae bacterium]
MFEKLNSLLATVRQNPLVARIVELPFWSRASKRLRPIAKQFDGPRHFRFEIVFMRVLLAVVVFQSMPLGAPFSNGSQRLANQLAPGKLDAILADPAKDNALRPPLLPISQMLPNSGASMTYQNQDKANGLAHLIDLTFFSDPKFQKALPWIVIPCLLLYAAGIGLPVVLPILTFVSIGSRTLYNSQGYIHHGYQMLSLVLVAQTVVVLWHCFRGSWREAFGITKAELVHGRTFWDRMIRYSQWMVVGCYVIAGVIKPVRSDGEWFQHSHYIGIQVVKTHRQNYYSRLEEKWDIPEPEVAKVMMKDHPDLTRIFLSCGVMLEIFAFLALYSRFLSLVIGFSLVIFHYFNDLMMGLYFYDNEKLDWIFLINLPFWIWWLWKWLRRTVPQEQEVGEVEPAAV